MVKIGVVALAVALLPAFAAPSGAQTHVVNGQIGILGEWELSATVTKDDPATSVWRGPLSLRHIGFCSVDSPQEKSGELRLENPGTPDGSSTAFKATLLIDGKACTFKGRRADGYEGVMACPGRADVPMMLTIQ
jgi:hypothetical protein